VTYKGETQLIKEFYIPHYESKQAYIDEWMKGENDPEKRKSIYDDLYKGKAEAFKLWVNSVTNARKIEFLDKVWRFYVMVGVVGIVIGLFLMIVGFFYWYRNIQMPLDYQSAQAFVQAKEKDLIIPP
jgi:hypothetical protein